MSTIEKVYKDGYLEKCELKEDEYGFYLDLHFAGIDGEDKDLYIPKVRLGFNRNVAPVIIEESIGACPWVDYCDYKVELGPGHRYIIENGDSKLVAKTGEIAKALDMISAVSLKECLSKAKKPKQEEK